MGQYVEYYCKNENSELKRVVDSILRKAGGVNPCEYDDFYSFAALFCWKCEEKYDPDKGVPFEPFFIIRLKNKIFTKITANNRQKRKANIEVIDEDTGQKKKIPVSDISLDTPIGENGEGTIGDFIQDKADVEECMKIHSDNVEDYLNNLSDTQRGIATLIMKGLDTPEIEKILGISDLQYKDAWKSMTSYEKKRIIRQENHLEESKMGTVISTEDVAETYKNTSYSIESISKQLQKNRIRDDHILQRYSGQWASFAKSELVSDILRGKSLTQIIISEEIKNGFRMQWLIDGKQRCTTLDSFLHDEFAVSKSIKNYNIKYQTVKIDEDGYEMLNEDGFTEMEYKEFDIRGKKFSQLPEELQDIFKDRQIPVLYNTNCTKKDIADDIARFNRSKAMNKAQSGWLGLEEGFAELVDNIAKMNFFQPEFIGTSYKESNRKSSAIRRIIVESIMVSDFLDDYNPDFNKMCEYLTEEAGDANFTTFYSLIERLMTVCDEETCNNFNVRDSFLWLGLFSRFVTLGINDSRFIDFIHDFNDFLHSKTINNITYDSLCVKEDGKHKATKDKTVVTEKINFLEKLMCDYFNINIEEIQPEEIQSEDISVVDFVRENIGQVLDKDKDGNDIMRDITEEDISFYEDMLDDLSLNVDNKTKLLEEQNHNSLISVVAYSISKDVDIDEWFIDYFSRTSNYKLNQKQNYIEMRNDLENYIMEHQKISA